MYLNYVQLAFTEFYGSTDIEPGLSENGEELTRMEYMASRTYLDLYSPESFDGTWRNAYQDIFKNVNALIPVAQRSNRHLHIGIAKVLKAYTAATLVDFFGDVPYSEASLVLKTLILKLIPASRYMTLLLLCSIVLLPALTRLLQEPRSLQTIYFMVVVLLLKQQAGEELQKH